MTKREMLAFLDVQLEATRQRGLVATGVTRTQLRSVYRATTEIRTAIEKHVPNDAPPVEQGELKGVA